MQARESVLAVAVLALLALPLASASCHVVHQKMESDVHVQASIASPLVNFQAPRRLMIMKGPPTSIATPPTAQAQPPPPELQRPPHKLPKWLINLIYAIAGILGVGLVGYGIHCCNNNGGCCNNNHLDVNFRTPEEDQAQAPAAARDQQGENN